MIAITIQERQQAVKAKERKTAEANRASLAGKARAAELRVRKLKVSSIDEEDP